MTMKHTKGPWYALTGDYVTTTVGPNWPAHEVASAPYQSPDTSLLALAPTAPHDCDHDGCPGRENKRKLEAAADLVAVLTAGNTEECYDSCHIYALAKHSPHCLKIRAAIARWEGR